MPFSDDADYFAAVQHDERANVLVGHHLNCVVDFVAGTDRPYLTALIFQDMTNSRHDSTKGSIGTSHKIRFAILTEIKTSPS